MKNEISKIVEATNSVKPVVKSSNAFERLPLHWKLLYYYAGGIITGLLLHYCL